MQSRLTESVLKQKLSNYLNRNISIGIRGEVDESSELFNLSEVVDIGEECEFRFYKQEWASSFIGKVLSYGSKYYSNNTLAELIRNNLEIGFIVQITGGPETLESLETKEIYFGLINVLSELFGGMIFIDPEGNINNNKFYNLFDKRLYTFEEFEVKNRYPT